jgi:hypothetical protein
MMNSPGKLMRITNLEPDVGQLERMKDQALALIDKDAEGLPWVQWRQRKDLEDDLARVTVLWEQERILERWIKVLSLNENT